MKITRIAGIAALLAAGFTQAQAQTPAVKFDGALIEFWYTQMLDNNLRYNSPAKSYYDGLSSSQANVGNAQGSLGRFQENTFAIKRSEVYLSGKVSDDVSWNVMFDPNNSANGTGNNVLQDAVVTWAFAKGFTLKAGQFKMPTTYESTLVSAREILFFDRTQLSRLLGERRDRGAWFSYGYGDAAGFQGKLNVAISNGTSDDGSTGKNNDANAQKDWTFRFDGGYGTAHKFGFWYREGETGLKSSATVAGTTAAWGATGATAAQILDNRDKTTAQGVFYAYDDSTWHADFEYATGLLGRRFPTLYDTTASAVKREHLDQKFTGYALTGVYKMGAHWLTARYDLMNYNSGDKWYTAFNPYKESAVGTPLLVNGAPVDYTPKYTEITVGYNYLFVPTKQTAGKLKLDYITRSKNFLIPRAGQTGEQGGNSLVASLMVAF
ncbi:porin [Geothrix sp. PMB-07]|uniref:porin n=1 Tax=Geothrix sp. PMB-07 TaxID=3068640 RepID=UPI0027424D06|nr:porin [Geothrix sp. PMB-07]WLT33108.1 porin [Geothrix sp. PMB-07]